MLSVLSQQLPIVECIIKLRDDLNLQMADCKGRTALWHAASNGNVAIMKALVNAKANLNYPDQVSFF